jgi:hypothetical protein
VGNDEVEGFDMRRFLTMGLVATLMAGGAASALAATVTNVTLTATVAQASWSDVDEDGNGEDVAVEFATSGGATTVSLFKSTGGVELCEGGDTPSDPDDDFYGFVGIQASGTGPAKLTVGRQYTSAKASGTVAAEISSFNECTGDFGTTTHRQIAVSVDLTAISRQIKETTRTTISIPKTLRLHQLLRAVSRDAAGTLKIGTRTLEVDGLVGRLSLKGHATTP